MIFTSLNDLYFFAAGIQGLNVITDIALETKLVLLPIILFILKELSKASQGDDEERVLLLKRLEIGVWTQIFVILVAFYPLVPVKVDGFALYAKQCEGYKEPKINKGFFAKGEKINDLQVMLSGGELKMPLLLSLAHTYGTGFSIESVDRLPCGINLQGVKSVLLENTIHDQRLLIETKHFIRRCYQPALNKAIRDPKNMLPWIEDPHTESQPWPGHEAFMNDEYYGAIGRGFYSDVLLPGWQGAKANKYNHWWMKSQQEERRGGCTTGDCIHQVGGFPSCQEWWHGIGAGWPGVHVSSNDMSLRKRLWDNLPEDDKDVIWPVLEQSFGNASRSDIWFQDKVVEKAYFSRVSMNRIMGAEPKDYGLEGGGAVKTVVGIITRLVGTVGNAATSAVEYAGASIVQMRISVKPDSHFG